MLKSFWQFIKENYEDATQPVTQAQLAEEPKEFDLGNTFPSGQYKIANTQEIDTIIPQITEYFKKFPQNQKVSVTIEASESFVPNSGVGLKPGELSKLRAQEIQAYLNGKLPANAVVTINDKGAQGPAWDPTKGANAPEYTQHQYVKLIVNMSGEKDQTTQVKTFCNTQIQAKGQALLPEQNYTTISDEQLGSGSGKLTLYFDSITVPDILYVEYNGQVYGDNILRGANLPYFSLAVATALNIAYPDGHGKPAVYSKTEWVAEHDLEKISADLAAAVLAGWTLGGKDGFFDNVYNTSTHFRNPQLVHVFQQIDALGSKANGNRVKRIIDGVQIPWAYLTTKIMPTANSATIDKVEGIDSIKVINAAPNGATKWRITGRCSQQ